VNAFDHLISQSPDKFWTSGQWMTERKGGSDVGEYDFDLYRSECLAFRCMRSMFDKKK